MLAITRGSQSGRIATAGPNLSWQSGSGRMVIREVGFSRVKAGLLDDRRASGEKKDDDFEPISRLAHGVWRYTPQFPQLVPGLFVQPVIQRIFNPNLSPPSSTVAAVRRPIAL